MEDKRRPVRPSRDEDGAGTHWRIAERSARHDSRLSVPLFGFVIEQRKAELRGIHASWRNVSGSFPMVRATGRGKLTREIGCKDSMNAATL